MSKPERSLAGRAVALLARRDHSRLELARKLAPHADSPAELEALLDDLEARQLLSDARYAEARAGALARKFGVSRIEHELRRQGVPDEAVSRATAGVRSTELDRARAAWRKRFGAPAADTTGRAKQMRFLQGRGFSFEVIGKVVEGLPDE